jgi:hypothetical protein
MLNVTHAFRNSQENEAKETVSCSFSFYLEKCERVFSSFAFLSATDDFLSFSRGEEEKVKLKDEFFKVDCT